MTTKKTTIISTENLEYFNDTMTFTGTMENAYGFEYLMDNKLQIKSHVTGDTRLVLLVEENNTEFIFEEYHSVRTYNKFFTLRLTK